MNSMATGMIPDAMIALAKDREVEVRAAKLLPELAPELATLLAEIPYTTLATVPLAYRVSQVARPLDGFGFLAPRGQGLRRGRER